MGKSIAAAGGGDDRSRKHDATQPEPTGYTPPKKKVRAQRCCNLKPSAAARCGRWLASWLAQRLRDARRSAVAGDSAGRATARRFPAAGVAFGLSKLIASLARAAVSQAANTGDSPPPDQTVRSRRACVLRRAPPPPPVLFALTLFPRSAARRARARGRWIATSASARIRCIRRSQTATVGGSLSLEAVLRAQHTRSACRPRPARCCACAMPWLTKH